MATRALERNGSCLTLLSRDDLATIIPRPGDPHDNEEFYSLYYNVTKEPDSPLQTRLSILKKLKREVSKLQEEDYVLDLGSGRQTLEADYKKRYGEPKFRFVTLDKARIGQNQLLADMSNLDHVQASGSSQPFKKETFSVVLSNMALDFMPPETMKEVHLALKPGGRVFVNLHHPRLVSDIDEPKIIYPSRNRSKKDLAKRVLLKASKDYKKYLKENDMLYKSHDEIKEAFGRVDLVVDQVLLKKSASDNWWEVDAHKRERERKSGNILEVFDEFRDILEQNKAEYEEKEYYGELEKVLDQGPCSIYSLASKGKQSLFHNRKVILRFLQDELVRTKGMYKDEKEEQLVRGWLLSVKRKLSSLQRTERQEYNRNLPK